MVTFGYIVLGMLALCAGLILYQNIAEWFEIWDEQFDDGDGE